MLGVSRMNFGNALWEGYKAVGLANAEAEPHKFADYASSGEGPVAQASGGCGGGNCGSDQAL